MNDYLGVIRNSRWKFTRTLLGDGNFKQDHLAMKDEFDDVSLSDGLGYMVGKKTFETYVEKVSVLQKTRNDTSKKSGGQDCHDHRAVSQQNHSQAHLDARGIGAIACGHHGCFYPNSVVNFRKGEGYDSLEISSASPDNVVWTDIDTWTMHLSMQLTSPMRRRQ